MEDRAEGFQELDVGEDSDKTVSSGRDGSTLLTS